MLGHRLGLLAVVAALCIAPANAAEIKLARHPDYHDGKIAFSYLGDIWTVKEDGSTPQRLTVNTSRDVMPRFSPDGKWIAFTSSRYGNPDVFIMPSEGGQAKQLTYHSAPDTVVGWSRDSQKVVFQSSRGLLFPGIPNLYEVPISGGLEQPIPTDWGTWGTYSPDGKRFAFNRHPFPWSRKHYRGSYCADLWVMDVENRSFKHLLDTDVPDDQKPNNFWPMYGNGEVYFVSDRDTQAKAGSPKVLSSINNIWKVAEYGGIPKQVTKHTSGSLFFPSMSSDGKVIVYEENFGLWKLDVATGSTSEVKINITADEQANRYETVTVNAECEQFCLSPSNKRAVISTKGDLFTIATDQGDVYPLTKSPNARDTNPQWSPDGKTIAFISDRSGREEIWTCDEKGSNPRKISDVDSEKQAPQWSPDAKFLLYTGSDKKLRKFDLISGETKVMASSTANGPSNARWSPDGKWIAYTKSNDATLLPHVYVIPADGSQPERRVTEADVYSDSNAYWTGDGKRLVYLAGLDVGNIGAPGRSTAQLYVVSLAAEERDPNDKNIDSEEDAVKAEREQRSRPGAGRGPGAPPAGGDGAEQPRGEARKVEVKIDFERLGRRARQLTRVSDNIGAMAVSPDGKTVVFTTSGTEGGRRVSSIWSINLDDGRQTRVVSNSQATPDEDAPPAVRFGFGGYRELQFAKDSRTLYYKDGDGIYSVSVSSGGAETAATPGGGGRFGRGGGQAPATTQSTTDAGSGATGKRINFTVRVEVDHRAERQQVFNEAWRVMKYRFYDPAMHGVDWNKAKAMYEPLMEHVASTEEMHDLVNMMIGELNASHTGISGGMGRGGDRTAGNNTRHPGFELTADSSGFYKVTHVYRDGPADKDWIKIKTGDFILAIDDSDLKAGDNYYKYYTHAPGTRLEFLVNDKPSKEGAWKVKIRPTSANAVGNWQYEKWVADRRALVDKLSGGEIGYLHIRQMNEQSLRQFEKDILAMQTKKGLIIDQRFNPGGNIDQELLQILGQRQYQYTKFRDSVQVPRPNRGFFGPMAVLENERSTSDAEVFPDGFRTLKLGKVIGVTTYGAVIGTGSYTLMDGSAIRTPGSGLWNVNGTNLENFGVPPDIYVDNTPEDFLKGRDAQIERAVEELKKEIGAKKAA